LPQAAFAFPETRGKPDRHGEPVASGLVISEKAAGGCRSIWRFRVPRWAADYPSESIVDPGRGGHSLTIRSLRR